MSALVNPTQISPPLPSPFLVTQLPLYSGRCRSVPAPAGRRVLSTGIPVQVTWQSAHPAV